MKYWLYSEGNIVGPYEPAEMLALPAFSEDSLVCPESATGDNPGDWRPALQAGEISAAMSVGAGRVVAAGPLTASYEYETGFNSAARYYEDAPLPQSPGYGDLLDAIDNILGAYKEKEEGKPAPVRPPETDYDLAEKFDIRLSRIQEELEAARWEKNLLLEKIRMKDLEEKKNRERIQELEARLKGEQAKAAEAVTESAKEVEQVRHLSDLRSRAETLRQIEEIRREEQALQDEAAREGEKAAREAAQAAAEAAAKPAAAAAGAPIEPAAVPAPDFPAERIEVKTFKSMKRAGEVKLESVLDKSGEAGEDDPSMTSRKLKSLGQTQPPAYVYDSRYGKPLPGPEAAPAGAFKPEAAAEPLPQQAGGIVYDFTVVTAKPPEVQQFRIEPRQEAPQDYRPVKPQTFDMGIQPAPAPQAYQAPQAQPAPAPQPYQAPQAQPAPAPVFQAQPAPQVQHAFQFGPASAPSQRPAPAPAPAQPAAAPAPEAYTVSPQAAAPAPAPAQPAAALSAAPVAQPAPAAAPDKTERISLVGAKAQPAPSSAVPSKKKGGRTAFVAILVIFGSIAAGGLGYFFMGEGGGFSGLSTMIPTGKTGRAPEAGTETAQGAEAQPQAQQPAEQQPAEAQPAKPEPQPAKPPVTAASANENIKKSLDIVKNYKLSGGRGTIASWFANSFLGNSGGANEEWTATPLHGDILVVQYRLLRPKQEPLVYQFEVDAAKRDIVRGINNNAIELLDQSGREKAVAAAVPARKKPAARKPARSKEIPILPLPDAPSAQGGEQEPTGFENPQPEGSDQVKYLKAQESDDELF